MQRSARGARVDQVDVHGEELTVRALDGSAVLSPVAVALDGCGVRVRDSPCASRRSTTCSSSSRVGHIQQEEEETSDDGDH